ncbi:uncharacterized protein L969DRAFT_52196 [Mixia osmundae IAM 14324]|uniref:Major facilitator superfamily (MFS) profile domain-containing protein n=1 Tax=Mixia osmundae (strain CBS 9802 / IAM 14324 / JCM 22182 / KY 12970) TaxID=764103 RepID=G7EAB1_MIXOS|nr:uncharacterized protein L969DRAFT_52196 [Mixia osmundae IAM 14324]KEI37830.1 hypothetical protein L969DRAFT_52196 [Mixia osmundae IAM 14324]GAA99771.1 hypothetical protein E5Q_06474 [Mixia osmundae IAM 14324]
MVLASEVPVAKRVAQVICSVFFCLTCAGLIFGFAALKPVLVDEGIYSELCTQDELQRDVWVCLEQDTRLNLMFTIATVVTNVSALPIGFLLDRIGPQRTSILGGCIFAIGCLLFGLGIRSPGVDTFLAGYVVIAVGSPLIFLPCFQLSNAFPANSGLVLSSLTGSFDASSLPLVAFRELHFGLGVSSKTFFLAYALLGLLVVLEQVLLAPKTSYARGDDPKPTQNDNTVTLVDEASTRQTGTLEYTVEPMSESNINASTFSRVFYGENADRDDVLAEVLSGDPLTGKLFGQSARQQILSSWFWLAAAFLCIHMLRINLYIQSAFTQLVHYTRDELLADQLTRAFTYLLPLGGIVAIPFVGYLLDKRSIRDTTIVLALFGVIFGIFGLAHGTPAQVVSIATLTLLRPLMYTAVSDYCAKTFGFQTFGTVYGLMNTLSGLFGLVQYALDLLIKGPLQGNYTPVNVGLLIAGLITSVGLASRIHYGTRDGVVALL